ncbi:hypothetical protein DA482_12425 [Pseudomonas fluorescens]|nr:hypothetical protein FIP59_20350 [Pseudomonas fluorescens]
MNAFQLWERACSRRRCVSQHIRQLIHRFREQARSHIGSPPFSKMELIVCLDSGTKPSTSPAVAR